MKIAIAQIDTVPGLLDQTLQRMISCTRRAAADGVDLLLFPATALTGVAVVGEQEREALVVDVLATLASLADKAQCPCIVPVVASDGSELFNEAVLVSGGELVPLKLMAYLGSRQGEGWDGPDVPAADLPEVRIQDMRVGIAFSYDDLDDYDAYDFDIDALICFETMGFALDDPSSALGADLADSRFVSDAMSSGTWLMGVGGVGGYGPRIYCGSSFVLDPQGRLVASSPAFEEDFLECSLGLDAAQERLAPEVFSPELHLWQALVLGLAGWASKVATSELALTLDGTIGSFVLAAISADAVGARNVHVLIDERAAAGRKDACHEFARNLGIDTRVLSLEETELPQGVDTAGYLAGLREATLFGWARGLHATVLSSVDKTALACDASCLGINPTMATLAPLGDVYRSVLLDLMRERNAWIATFPQLLPEPRDMVRLEGVQADAAEAYEWNAAVDAVLVRRIEHLQPAADIAHELDDVELVDQVLLALDRSEAARRTFPPVLVVTSRPLLSLGRPIALVWHEDATHDRRQVLDRLATSLDHAAPEWSGGDAGGGARRGGAGTGTGKPHTEDELSHLREALGLIHELSAGGGLTEDGMAPEEPVPPAADAPGARHEGVSETRSDSPDNSAPRWRGPFSEN